MHDVMQYIQNYKIFQMLFVCFCAIVVYFDKSCNTTKTEYLTPVEVKSEGNIESISLKKYKEKYGAKTKLRLRFSMQNLKLDGDLLNIPLFLADHAYRLIGMALDTKPVT